MSSGCFLLLLHSLIIAVVGLPPGLPWGRGWLGVYRFTQVFDAFLRDCFIRHTGVLNFHLAETSFSGESHKEIKIGETESTSSRCLRHHHEKNRPYSP